MQNLQFQTKVGGTAQIESMKTSRQQKLDELTKLLDESIDVGMEEATPDIMEQLNKANLLETSGLGEALARENDGFSLMITAQSLDK